MASTKIVPLRQFPSQARNTILLIPNPSAKKSAQTNSRDVLAKTVEFKPRPAHFVTQSELEELHFLRRHYLEAKSKIRALLESGAGIEDGIHVAWLDEVDSKCQKRRRFHLA
jgi:hypothetical protein